MRRSKEKPATTAKATKKTAVRKTKSPKRAVGSRGDAKSRTLRKAYRKTSRPKTTARKEYAQQQPEPRGDTLDFVIAISLVNLSNTSRIAKDSELPKKAKQPYRGKRLDGQDLKNAVLHQCRLEFATFAAAPAESFTSQFESWRKSRMEEETAKGARAKAVTSKARRALKDLTREFEQVVADGAHARLLRRAVSAIRASERSPSFYGFTDGTTDKQLSREVNRALGGKRLTRVKCALEVLKAEVEQWREVDKREAQSAEELGSALRDLRYHGKKLSEALLRADALSREIEDYRHGSPSNQAKPVWSLVSADGLLRLVVGDLQSRQRRKPKQPQATQPKLTRVMSRLSQVIGEAVGSSAALEDVQLLNRWVRATDLTPFEKLREALLGTVRHNVPRRSDQGEYFARHEGKGADGLIDWIENGRCDPLSELAPLPRLVQQNLRYDYYGIGERRDHEGLPREPPTDRQLAVISLLCGQWPELSAKQRRGCTVAEVIQVQRKAVRRARSRFEERDLGRQGAPKRAAKNR